MLLNNCDFFLSSFFKLVGDLDELRQKDYEDQRGMDKAKKGRPKIDEKAQVSKGNLLTYERTTHPDIFIYF